MAAADLWSPPLGNDQEEVLIEKDGVFELVSALEVHAERDRMEETEQIAHADSPYSNSFENSSTVSTIARRVGVVENEPDIERQQELTAGAVSRSLKDPGVVDLSPVISDQSKISRNQTEEPSTQLYDPPLSADDKPGKAVPSSAVIQEGLETAPPSLENGPVKTTPTTVFLQDQPSAAQPPSSEKPAETTVVSKEQPRVKETGSSRKGMDQGLLTEPLSTAGDQISQEVSGPRPAAELPSQRPLSRVPSTQPGSLSSPSPAVNVPDRQVQASRVRTVSVPAARLARAKGAGSMNQEKRKMNELAFEAWLKKKNNDVWKRRELERKQASSPQEIERKEENERAFRHWLETKKRQPSAQPRLQSPPAAQQNISGKDQEKRNLEAWQIWLTRKLDEKRRENQLETRRKNEMELAGRGDPDVSRWAYKE